METLISHATLKPKPNWDGTIICSVTKTKTKETGSPLPPSSFAEVEKLEPVKNYLVVTKNSTSVLFRTERRKAEILSVPGRP